MVAGAFYGDFLHVVVDHEVDELFEAGLFAGVPAEAPFGFGGVTPEVDDVGGTVEVGADFDEDAAGGGVDTFLVGAFAFPAQFDAGAAEGELAEFAHGVLFAGGDDEVFGLVLLQDEPHAFNVVFGIAPVAKARQITQIELILLALRDARRGKGDLARHEGLAATLRLVVEQNARAAIHAVSLAVLLDDPKAVQLRHGIGRIGMERSLLVLRNLLHLTVKL